MFELHDELIKSYESIESMISNKYNSIDISFIEEFNEYQISEIDLKKVKNEPTYINENSLILIEEDIPSNNSFLFNEDKIEFIDILNTLEQNIPQDSLVNKKNNNKSKNKSKSNISKNNNKVNINSEKQNKRNKKLKYKEKNITKKNQINDKIKEENEGIELYNQFNLNNNNSSFIEKCDNFFIKLEEENEEKENNDFMNNIYKMENSEQKDYNQKPNILQSSTEFEQNNSFDNLQNNDLFDNFIKKDYSIKDENIIFSNKYCNNAGLYVNNNDKFIFTENKRKRDTSTSKNKNKINETKYNNNNINLATSQNINKNENNKQNLAYINYNINENNNNKNGGVLFNTKKNIYGRKKKGNTTIGKHNKNAPDNMLSTIKRFIFRTIREIINNELKNIKNDELKKNFHRCELLQIIGDQTKDTTKIFNLNLLKKTLKSIFSEKVTGRWKDKENHNRDLINKLYEINNKGDLDNQDKIENIVNFLNMTLEDFFNYLKIYINNNISKEKEKEKSINIINNDINNINSTNNMNIINNNIFTFNLIKQFINKVNEEFIVKKEDEDFIKKFNEKLMNLPLVINNMKGGKNKKII